MPHCQSHYRPSHGKHPLCCTLRGRWYHSLRHPRMSNHRLCLPERVGHQSHPEIACSTCYTRWGQTKVGGIHRTGATGVTLKYQVIKVIGKLVHDTNGALWLVGPYWCMIIDNTKCLCHILNSVPCKCVVSMYITHCLLSTTFKRVIKLNLDTAIKMPIMLECWRYYPLAYEWPEGKGGTCQWVSVVLVTMLFTEDTRHHWASLIFADNHLT